MGKHSACCCTCMGCMTEFRPCKRGMCIDNPNYEAEKAKRAGRQPPPKVIDGKVVDDK